MKLWDKITGIFRKKPAVPDLSEPLRALDPETNLPAPYPWYMRWRLALKSRTVRVGLIVALIGGARLAHRAMTPEQAMEALGHFDGLLTLICDAGSIWFGLRASFFRVKGQTIATERGWFDAGTLLRILPAVISELKKDQSSPDMADALKRLLPGATPFALAWPEFPAKSFASPPRAAGDVLARVTAQPKLKRPVVLDDLDPSEAETAGRVAQSLTPDPERSAAAMKADALRDALVEAGVFISDEAMAHAEKMQRLGFRPDQIVTQVRTAFPAPEPKPAAKPKPKK